MSRQVFTFIMIRTTHYDDDGYPIQWLRSMIPSNSLASVNSLARDCVERQVLGSDVDIRLRPIDETNTRVQPKKLIREIEAHGGRALVGFVGIQSNQFPRAMDLAQSFVEAGIPVCIGGFHVAGCIAMLPELPAELKAARDQGISLFAGEAEEDRLEEILRDAYEGKLKPIYNFMDDLPTLAGQPVPFLSQDVVQRTDRKVSSFDLGRGCPFKCSFCTIINVQGRKSRFRSADDLEKIIRENAAQGVRTFFITDDNFARNRDWEAMLDRLIWLRKFEGLAVNLIIQVDTQCHKLSNFIEKACLAGVSRVFVGLENINPDNLLAAKKNQNKITDYRLMLQRWRQNGAVIYAGYILGFPGDTKERILRDVEIIKNELPIDILEFFYLTPLPGSEDHKTLTAQGVWMDPDLNKYDLNHRVSHHPRMSDTEWEEAYRQAWKSFFSPEHVMTVMRRAAQMPRTNLQARLSFMFEFLVIFRIEGVHPLEGGLIRMKHRRDRRPGLKVRSPFVFYPALAAETAVKLVRYGAHIARAWWIYWRVSRDPERFAYTDTAIAPPKTDELEEMSLYQETSGGHAAVERKKLADRLRKSAKANAA